MKNRTRLLAGLLSLLFLFTSIPAAALAGETFVPTKKAKDGTLVGDVNKNNTVDATDRMLLARFLAGWEGYADRILSMDAADIDRDGDVNAKDRMLLARFLAGWEGYEVYFENFGVDAVDHGKCGDNLFWELLKDGTLRIAGSGKMYDYEAGTAPWYERRESITKLAFPAGITSIGFYAFSACDSLTGSLSLPDGLISIGDGAFRGCQGIEGVLTVPEKVDTIGSSAFEGCEKIIGAVFKGEAPSMGDNVFSNTADGFVIYCEARNADSFASDSAYNKEKATWNGYYFDSKIQEKIKVLVLNFDPIFEQAGGVRQHELLDWWNDPHELAQGYSQDMFEVSRGYLDYEIAEWLDLEELPRDLDGIAYTPEEYYDILIPAIDATDGAYWQYPGWRNSGFNFDYDWYLSKYHVYDRVNRGEIDEVWFFTGPMEGAGLYESRMVGRGAYWCNSPGLEKDCDMFVAFGFSYERGIGEMLEDAGHRAESILHEVYGWADYEKDYHDFNDWEKFSVYDLLKPGMSGPGNVHFAPNSESDYDWGNSTPVESFCDDWIHYPDLTGEKKTVDCSDWGDGDIRLHHKWWFHLFPHTGGMNPESGKFNNWWRYYSLGYLK